MKQLALTTAFVAAAWIIGIAVYTLYESLLADNELVSASRFDYRGALIGALNYSLPAALVCLVFLVKTSSVNPVGVEMLMICGGFLALGVFLSFKAKSHAFPDVSDRTFVESVWWIPSEKEIESDYGY